MMFNERKGVCKEMSMALKPRLLFCDAREDGSGSVLQIELHPATIEHQGSIMLEFVKQRDNGYCNSDGYHNGSFDWNNTLKFRIGLTQIAEMLGVIDGDFSTVGFGNGVQIDRKKDVITLYFVKNDKDSRLFKLTAVVDAVEEWNYSMTRQEALVFKLAIESAFAKLAWGN